MELNTLSLEAMTLLGQKLDFERLEVNVDLAMEMFEDNRFKTAQIPFIAAADSQGRVTVYRIGNHVDISQGPLIANTSQIGRFTITKVIILMNQILKEFHRIVPWVTLLKNCSWNFDPSKNMAAVAFALYGLIKILQNSSPLKLLVRFWNNFTELFLSWPFLGLMSTKCSRLAFRITRCRLCVVGRQQFFK